MASHKQIIMALALIAVSSMLSYTAKAQSNDCTNVIVSMSPCLNYITGNSSRPTSSCCTQLGTVVRSQPECLCQVLNGGGSNLGLNINQTQALDLPRQCNVQTPPVSQCSAVSPSGSTPDSPNPNPGGAGGTRTTPSTGDGTSDASSTTLAFPMLCFLLFIASYLSSFSMG